MNLHTRVNKGFTLIEVAASVVLLSILLSGVYMLLQNSTKSVANNLIRERALEVARRHMEMLLVTKQEPDSTGLETIDELDPDFTWTLDLEREALEGMAATLEKTLIHATITVKSSLSDNTIAPVELHRFFASLKPKPGNAVAVPLTQTYEMDDTYKRLFELLGREPTAAEIEEYQSDFEE